MPDKRLEENTSLVPVGEHRPTVEVISPVPIVKHYEDFYRQLRILSIETAVKTTQDEMVYFGYQPIDKEALIGNIKQRSGFKGLLPLAEILGLTEQEAEEFCLSAYKDKQTNPRQPMAVVFFLRRLLDLPENYFPAETETGIDRLDLKRDILSSLDQNTLEEINRSMRNDQLELLSRNLKSAGRYRRHGLTQSSSISNLVREYRDRLTLPAEGG